MIWRIPFIKRGPWRPFLIKAALVAITLFLAFDAIAKRYRLGIDWQIERCLPDTRAVLIDLRSDMPKRGELIAFRGRGLEPLFTTENALRDHQGRLLAPAGARISPLAALPFTSRILIFDGTDAAERQWARDHIRPDRKTILITTRIDRDVGWPAWKELHQTLGLPVYLLQARIAERFALEVTPTMIEADPDGGALLITEDVPTNRENPS